MLKILNKILAPIAPSLITWGIMRYHQKKYKAARKNLKRGLNLWQQASEVEPNLIDQAYLILAEYRLGGVSKLDELKELAPKINDYEKRKDREYWHVKNEIDSIISE